MQAKEALQMIDGLLDAVERAEEFPASDNEHDEKTACVSTQDCGPYIAFDRVNEGQSLRVTTNLDKLTSEWQKSELGPNDELDSYLGVVGKVMELEDDDNTVELRWLNLDTAWIPVNACHDAGNSEPTLPGSHVSWIPDKAPQTATESSSNNYLSSYEQVSVGQTLRVTSDLGILVTQWTESELGPNDELDIYLGCVGRVMEIEDDDETVQLRWLNLDTVWIPVKACTDANGVEETLPGSGGPTFASELPPEESKEPEYLNLATDAKEGMHVMVTRHLDLLELMWAEAELGPNDELSSYLGCVGEVHEIEDDDDTLKIRWENMDTCWVPAKACSYTEEGITVPGSSVSWLG